MLTGYTDDAALAAAKLAGAGAFLAKDTPCRKLVEHILAVARGESSLNEEMNERVQRKVNNIQQYSAAGQIKLTERERRILGYIVQGQTNKEIAHNMNLCEKTVRNYVSILLRKLQVGNRAEAAACAVQEHILW
jgi:DNA-binding NarL/FixJ family response regulator